MPYNSPQSQRKHVKKNIFDYVRWSMEEAMHDEDNVNKYYNRFLDLAKPLLNSHWLDNEECNTLFWYGFHLENHTMILGWFHPKHISKNQHFLFHLIQSYYILFLLFWG